LKDLKSRFTTTAISPPYLIEPGCPAAKRKEAIEAEREAGASSTITFDHPKHGQKLEEI